MAIQDRRPKRVVVIGAGINGLVAAHYLRRAGCKPSPCSSGPSGPAAPVSLRLRP